MNLTKVASFESGATRLFHRITLTSVEARVLSGALCRAATTGKPERIRFEDGEDFEVLIPQKPSTDVASHMPVDPPIGDLF
jgi:hypothetical protein